MSLRNLITPIPDFQTSVNLAYDLNDEGKIRAFIPTTASLEIIGDVLVSTHPKATQRARILTGAYGRGKSHIVLVLLALLRMRNKDKLFDAMLSKMREHDAELARFTKDTFNGKRKLLPVVVHGSNSTLSQAFLNALQFSLENASLEHLIPDTHFQAAHQAIVKWQANYPATASAFTKKIGRSLDGFLLALDEHDAATYERFVALYPDLTSGSVFNPFIGFDVPNLYEIVARKVRDEGYSGLYVVYDEFSKYLESSIATATVSDTKMLQDFAEKCNRSGETQLHLMLICHKDIANYIDSNLPKEKVDGWRGVSGRFLNVHLHNNFSQVYELVAAVLQKTDEWSAFRKKNQTIFDALKDRFTKNRLFDAHEIPHVVYGCYPLHPLATFILPRLSERVAQNERTLFTFLAAHERRALSEFLEVSHGGFPLLTADRLYDYFEPLIKKEPNASEAHKLWRIAENALRRVEGNVLGAKIIKVIALIYLLEQFEKLPPTVDIITDAFRWSGYDEEEVSESLAELQEKECVVYLKRSNQHLRIKESSGADIQAAIAAFIEKHRNVLTVKETLNSSAFESSLYPVRYNDENDITRYFDFIFISGEEVLAISDWAARLNATPADGIVYAVVPTNANETAAVRTAVRGIVHPRLIFAIPERPDSSIESTVFEYEAVRQLKEQAEDDTVLREEYDIWLDDLAEIVGAFSAAYTHPGQGNMTWWHCGKNIPLARKSQLSEKLSKICETVYTKAPRINNESINKNTLSGTARNSRAKILAGLLANELSPNLGLTGTGQEVSMMRSVLVVTDILKNRTEIPAIDLEPQDERMRDLLGTIRGFFNMAARKNGAAFSDLYDTLTRPDNNRGLKRGVIPVFIAAVLHSIKRTLVILHNGAEVRITAELLADINDNPKNYTVAFEDWNKEKTAYLVQIEKLFASHVIESEKSLNAFTYLTLAINRWYMSLPKYAKEFTQGQFHDKGKTKFIESLRQPDINPRQYLFETLPATFGEDASLGGVADMLAAAKQLFDNAVSVLLDNLGREIKSAFGKNNSRAGLASTVKDWHDALKQTTRQRLFESGENRILELMATITNDESAFIQRLAKTATGLRVEDWNTNTETDFLAVLKTFKENIETFDKKKDNAIGLNYRLVMTEKDGRETIKTFPKTKTSARAELLRNEITTALDEMGQAITDSEKRQILMEVLEKLC